MRRAARAAAACLAAAAACPAAAFVRTNTCPNDPGAGYALWWDGNPPVLSYRLSTVHVPVGCAPAGCGSASCGSDLPTLEALVNASVATWSAAGDPGSCTGLRTSYGGRQSDPARWAVVGADDGQNLIVFRTRSCSEPGAVPAGDPCLTRGGCGNLYDCWDATSDTRTLALTVVTYRTGSGQIIDADMELWDWNGSTTAPTGHYFTCAAPGSPGCTGAGYGQEGCIQWDAGSVVTHEAGHMIGLDHETRVPSVMSPSLAPTTTAQRTLQPDDVQAVCGIYPPGQPAVQQKLAGSCTTSSRRSCGCGGEAAGLPALLVLPFLRRRAGRGPRREVATADRLG